MFSSIVHISPTTSLVVGTNPPAHPQWHDAVLDLHAHEYTAVHTRGQHPFSPFHISLLCVFMCIVGTWNMLLSGIKVNSSKTEGLWIGSLKNNQIKPFGIKWPKEPIKA